MPKNLDIPWLIGQAQDDETRRRVRDILDQRKSVLKNNVLPGGDEKFPMRLGNHRFLFTKGSAFSSIEVYHEIFREQNHFLVPGFTGEDAGVVVDIGANEGFYALRMKEIHPDCRIVCVEPNPHLFEILETNIGWNAPGKVSLVNKAVSDRVGSMEFEFVKGIGAIGSRNLGMVARPWLKKEFISRIRVDTTTLNQLARDLNVSDIDILKIDVEGMEREVLEGGRDVLKSVGKLVIERHSVELRNQVVSILKGIGYELLYEEDPGFERYYGDLYFTNRHPSGKSGLST